MNDSIFFQCQVLDNNDPMMLGRVRAKLLIDNYEDIVRSITDPPWNPEKDPWTVRDPFVFIPLLPYFVYQVPKVDELIQIIYVNKDFKYLNQYYVQSNFSTPTTIPFEYYQGGNKFTGTGGQISNPKPLKNQDGTYPDAATYKGVFPEPGDNGILGRGSSDLIVKENDVLLRSGKYKGTLEPNTDPEANNQRGFLQISKFASTKNNLKPKKILEIRDEVVLVNYLIEWVITNPENTQEKFSGTVYLYQLKQDLSTNSNNVSVDSVIPENLKNLTASESFSLLSKVETIAFINNFISTCNTSNVTKSGKQLFSQNNNKFPIFYRPNNYTYSLMQSNGLTGSQSGIVQKNISEIFNGIRLNSSTPNKGYGLIYAQDKIGKPVTTKLNTVIQQKYINNESTYAALGGDKLFFLSHLSAIPGKGKINLDNTLYGIPQDTFADQIIPKTSSMVRGEELMELINLIVRFLITHTHAYPGLPPVPVTQDGSDTATILTELQNAVNKILNENLRLN
jgi:hypothetical protein